MLESTVYVLIFLFIHIYSNKIVSRQLDDVFQHRQVPHLDRIAIFVLLMMIGWIIGLNEGNFNVNGICHNEASRCYVGNYTKANMFNIFRPIPLLQQVKNYI